MFLPPKITPLPQQKNVEKQIELPVSSFKTDIKPYAVAYKRKESEDIVPAPEVLYKDSGAGRGNEDSNRNNDDERSNGVVSVQGFESSGATRNNRTRRPQRDLTPNRGDKIKTGIRNTLAGGYVSGLSTGMITHGAITLIAGFINVSQGEGFNEAFYNGSNFALNYSINVGLVGMATGFVAGAAYSAYKAKTDSSFGLDFAEERANHQERLARRRQNNAGQALEV